MNPQGGMGQPNAVQAAQQIMGGQGGQPQMGGQMGQNPAKQQLLQLVQQMLQLIQQM